MRSGAHVSLVSSPRLPTLPPPRQDTALRAWWPAGRWVGVTHQPGARSVPVWSTAAWGPASGPSWAWSAPTWPPPAGRPRWTMPAESLQSKTRGGAEQQSQSVTHYRPQEKQLCSLTGREKAYRDGTRWPPSCSQSH